MSDKAMWTIISFIIGIGVIGIFFLAVWLMDGDDE
jgi:predicted membrane channel-forming protein YqfA (hemolysin III family)